MSAAWERSQGTQYSTDRPDGQRVEGLAKGARPRRPRSFVPQHPWRTYECRRGAVPRWQTHRRGAAAMSNTERQARLAAPYEALSTLPDYVG